jgi:hypothetical protein
MFSQNPDVHKFLWSGQKYLLSDNGKNLFYADFDGVSISFWESVDNPIDFKWEYEKENNTLYYIGMHECRGGIPTMMRLHTDGRITHAGVSLFHEHYRITLTVPVMHAATSVQDRHGEYARNTSG